VLYEVELYKVEEDVKLYEVEEGGVLDEWWSR